MHRVPIIGLVLLLLACSNDQKRIKNQRLAQADTIALPGDESFDLQVKKYEDPKRQNWQDPQFVIEALGDLQNKTIADVGSGTGYFTFQMAVPAKKVIAIDIEQRFLNYIEDRKTEMYDKNLAAKIETRLTEPDDPKLADGEVDIILVVNTISFIADRENYLTKLSNGLTSGGMVVIVDYELGEMPVGPAEQFKVDQSRVSKELRAAGFSIENIDTASLQYQYLIKARKK
jgi:2-polyprenyl-3-methyl-5-hydroxy-6-metoxy-1,4-benzoquinol methylase